MLKMDHIGIAVKNLEESVNFYTSVFGFEKCGGHESERVNIVYLKLENQVIELLKYSRDDERGKGVIDHLAFTVKDINAEIERIKKLGAKMIFDEPRDSFGMKIMFFEGPNGERLELVEYKA